MFKLAQNTFNKGFGKDIDPRNQNVATYRKAVNMVLTGDGDFMSLKNMKSSKKVFTKGSRSFNNLLGAFELDCVYKNTYSSEEVNPSIIYFSQTSIGTGGLSGIYLYDIINEEHYTIYESINYLRFQYDSTIDAVIEGEGGVDIIYWVDGNNVPRQFSAIYDPLNPIESYKEFTSLRFAPIDELSVTGVSEGGNIPSGSYQFAYQYINTETGRESTFSPITNPVPIFPSNLNPTGGRERLYGGLPNESTAKKVSVVLGENIDSELLDLYDAVVLAVIKNVDGSKTPATIAHLLPPSKEFYNARVYEYNGNENVSTLNIEEVTIGDANIKTAETITIKEGNMFLGNVTYRELKIADDECVIGSAKTILKKIGTPSDHLLAVNSNSYGYPTEATNPNKGYKDPLNCMNYKSEMRGEVIRYGVICMDEYGAWSDVKTLDFTDFSADTKTTDPLYVSGADVHIATFDEKTGLTRLDVTDNGGNSVIPTKTGDSITLANGFVPYVFKVEGNVIYVEQNQESSLGTTIFYNQNGLFSNMRGTDWRYPRRDTPYGSIMDGDDLVSMGLSIEELTDLPSWAKAVQIVRAERRKDIVAQSLSLTVVSVNSADRLGDNYDNTDCERSSDANYEGTFTPKFLSRGMARNYLRESLYDRGESSLQSWTYLQWDTSTDKGAKQNTLAYVFPPQYLASNSSGVDYDQSFLLSGKKIQTVDVVSFIANRGVDVDGSNGGSTSDNGSGTTDQSAVAYRADSYFNYHVSFKNTGAAILSIEDDSFQSLNPATSEVKQMFTVANGQKAEVFPFMPVKENVKQTGIVKYSDISGVADYAYNQGGYGFKNAKGVYINANRNLGDPTLYSSREPTGITGVNQLFDFSRHNQANSNLYNVQSDAFSVEGNPQKSLNTIRYREGSAFASSIINITKGLPLSNRYGGIDEKTTFYSTGSYKVKKGLTSFEVFGGDTFITKSTVKINDTIAYSATGDSSCANQGDTKASFVGFYQNWAEVLSYFVESEINCDLFADNYAYPVTDTKTLTEYDKDFRYPYHFGYSINNILSVYSSRDNTVGEFDSVFPARVVYSDRHLVNSKDGAYSRFRADSFFDLSETYGGITKLVKLADDNVYCLQDKGLSLIPIGKRVIEEADGGTMVVNSGELIDTARFLLNKNGCQHIRTVAVSENSFFWVDVVNREVFSFNPSDGVKKLSDSGMYSYFLDKLDSKDTPISEVELSGAYDLSRSEYIVNNNNSEKGFTVSWSDKTGSFVTEYDFGQESKVMRMIGAFDRLFIMGTPSESVFNIEEMYRGEGFGSVLGSDNTSEFSVIMNQEGTFAKTLDVLRIDSNNRLSTIQAQSFTEDEKPDQDTGVFSLNIEPRQGAYELPIIRDLLSKGRLRGKYFEVTFTIDNVDDKEVKVNNIVFKYRNTENRFRPTK